MQATTRKGIAEAIKRAHPGAQVSWSGEARIITLHVMRDHGGSEFVLSIDNEYVTDAASLKQLTSDILDGLGEMGYD